VSVIVPTKNSNSKDHSFQKTLLSVHQQTYKNIELIVCDNFSKDDTVKIAKTFGAKVFYQGLERSRQKNLGVRKAKGKYLLFLDSDGILTENVVFDCVEKVKDGMTKMVIIPEKNIGEGYWAKVKALERSFYLGDDQVEAPWFFEKKAFLKVGGYNSEMYAGEDWDLFERMKQNNHRFARIESFIWHNLGRLTLKEILMKKYYYSLNIKVFIASNPGLSVRRAPLFRKSLVKNFRYLFSQPLVYLGTILVNFLEAIVVAFGFLFSLIKK